METTENTHGKTEIPHNTKTNDRNLRNTMFI